MPNLVIIPARALEDRSLTGRDLRALCAVGMYTNSAGKGVWASQTTMADRVGVSRQQMNASLRVLSQRGYIRKYRRTKPDGSSDTCLIDIILDGPPVPEMMTPPVPVLGTPPVLESGTQTTQQNDPTTRLQCVAALVGEHLTVEQARLTGLWFGKARDPERFANAVLELAIDPKTLARGLYELAVVEGVHTLKAVGAFSKDVAGRDKPRSGKRDWKTMKDQLKEG